MELTQPPEMTTALTDLVLGVFALFLAWRLRRYHRRDETGVAVWLWFFTLLGLTALGGVPAHGLKCFAEPGPAQYVYWMPYSLLPGVTVSVFVIGVIQHWKGTGYVRAATYVMLPVCALFFVAMIVLSKRMEDYFLIFIVFESTCMLFALIVYCALAISRKTLFDGVMAVGVVLTILGAVLQAQRSISFTLIWAFDYNGVYHVIQLAATYVLYLGVVWRLEKTEAQQAT